MILWNIYPIGGIMNNSLDMKKESLMAFGKNWGYFLAWGIALIILGIVALYFTTATTLISVALIGVLLFISGVVVIVDTFQFWWGKWKGFIWHFLIGALYLIAGIILLSGPILGAMSLTLFLGSFFVIVGIFRIIYSIAVRMTKWGWNLVSGIISLVLGLMILSEWPGSSLFILGLFVGIDLLMIGWTYVMVALAAKGLAKNSQ